MFSSITNIRALVAADMNSLQNRLELKADALQAGFESASYNDFSIEDEVRKS
jgi:hypothetical protein